MAILISKLTIVFSHLWSWLITITNGLLNNLWFKVFLAVAILLFLISIIVIIFGGEPLEVADDEDN